MLRASVCKCREPGAGCEIFNFLIFCLNKPFTELFSKIQLKAPKALYSFKIEESLKIAILAFRRRQSKRKWYIFFSLVQLNAVMFTNVLLANYNTILALFKTVVYFGKAFKFSTFPAVLTTPLEVL